MNTTREFRSDELELVVLPQHGARMHSIRAFGELVTHTPRDASEHVESPFHWGGYHMVPWCNRLRPGPVEVLGRRVDLAPNFDDGSAIHGLHVMSAWEERDDRFLATRAPDRHWPWPYTAAVTYRVDGPVLTIGYELRNEHDEPMIGGVGFHPWFRIPSRVRIPSPTVFTDLTAAAASPEPVSGAYDLRAPGPIEPGVDACWPDLERPAIDMWWDELGLALEYSGRRPDGGSVLAVAAHIPDVGAAAVELQTHAPQGIRRLLGDEPWPLDVIVPGGALALELTLTFSQY